MNKNIRRKDRAITDINQIVQIINQAKILHLGIIDDGYPYIVPLHYGYAYDIDTDKFFYMHGAKEGHKIDLIARNSNAWIELETDIELQFTNDTPCQYSSFYSSVIGQGCVSIVEDAEEKKHALNLLMINQTGREFEFTDEMASAVAIIKAEITNYTAKAKTKAS